MAQRAPVLMYHQVAPDHWPNRHRHIVVRQSAFEAQVRELSRSGWSFTTQRELANSLKTGIPMLKPVVLTFDDVSSCFIDYALPILNETSAKATLFIIGNSVLGRPVENIHSPSIRWPSDQDLRELDPERFEIGSHCMTHRSLTSLSKTDLRNELRDSRKILEDKFERQVESLCYPLGYYNAEVIEEAQAAGFTSACTLIRGTRQVSSKPFSLSRVAMGDRHVGRRLKWATSSLYGFKTSLRRQLKSFALNAQEQDEN